MHSIIIPHRNRYEHLATCLWSLHRSARHMHVARSEYEIIVVDNGSPLLPTYRTDIRLVLDESSMRIFNKPKLLNLGISAAKGDILTFLDCDMIVGLKWMGNVHLFDTRPEITRLCYRSAHLPPSYLRVDRMEESVDLAFGQYAHFKRRDEAHCEPQSMTCKGEPLFGNSQCSMTRDALGAIRYNEKFVGAGFEDIWFTREVWRRHGEKYLGVMPTQPRECMFHIKHDLRQPNWRGGVFLDANSKMYWETN